MIKHRNKKMRKLNKLREELEICQSKSYYHQIEDVEDIKNKIRLLEETL